MTLDEAAVELEQIAEWIDDAQGRTTPTIPTPDLYRADSHTDSHRLRAFISIWLEHAYTLLLASEEGIRSALSELHPKTWQLLLSYCAPEPGNTIHPG
jgi:hypothetical protein